ncbi:MAG: helix-turn-helix domain-containing protein [Butyrivibrio sp.]
MDSLKKNLSYQLKEYRRQNSLSQERAAEILGISTVFYGDIERAKRLPSIRLLVKLCRTIGCSELRIDGFGPASPPLTKEAEKLMEIIRLHPEIAGLMLSIAESLISSK